MFALECRCARHIFRQWQKECCHGNGILWQKMGGKNLASRTTSSVFHQFSWNLAQMFCLGGVDVQDTFFDSGRKCVCHGNGILWQKMGEKSCVANYFLSFSPILMKFGTDVLPWGVDVQDTFFDSGRKCVAMVTAYYGKKWGGKSCVANYFLSFSPILMNFGTDVCLWGVDVQDTFFDSGRKCVAMVTAYYTVKKYCGAGGINHLQWYF